MREMLCEKCKKNSATVCITTVINGDKTVRNLCASCAGQEGQLPMEMPFGHDFSWQKLWPTIFSLGQGDMMMHGGSQSCPQCNLSFQEFAKGGRLGCSRCYQAFQPQLKPILQRIQGNGEHKGKVPKRMVGVMGVERQIEALRGRLQQAISVENFELAARLRDEIRELQKSMGGEALSHDEQ